MAFDMTFQSCSRSIILVQSKGRMRLPISE